MGGEYPGPAHSVQSMGQVSNVQVPIYITPWGYRVQKMGQEGLPLPGACSFCIVQLMGSGNLSASSEDNASSVPLGRGLHSTFICWCFAKFKLKYWNLSSNCGSDLWNGGVPGRHWAGPLHQALAYVP